MTLSLAFYCGQGDWIDAAIRKVTRSRFSHVELVLRTKHGTTVIGASWRDRGVRTKAIEFRPDAWAMIPVPWAPQDAFRRAELQIGARYDLVGVLFSQFFAFRREDHSRWFCSELCAFALGLGAPETFSPGSLFSAALDLNRVWSKPRMKP